MLFDVILVSVFVISTHLPIGVIIVACMCLSFVSLPLVSIAVVFFVSVLVLSRMTFIWTNKCTNTGFYIIITLFRTFCILL